MSKRLYEFNVSQTCKDLTRGVMLAVEATSEEQAEAICKQRVKDGDLLWDTGPQRSNTLQWEEPEAEFVRSYPL